MQISIRSLLAVLFLSALAFLAVRTTVDLRKKLAHQQQLVAEAKQVETSLRLNDADFQLRQRHVRDEQTDIKRSQTIAHEQFLDLQKRYGTVQPKGESVFSLRRIPQVLVDRRPPVSFRFYAPPQRQVYLKTAVVARDGGHQSEKLDQLNSESLQISSNFTRPLEQKVSAGLHVLDIQIGLIRKSLLGVEVRLDDQILFRDQHDQGDDRSSGASYVSGRQQIDVQPDRPLPWILSSRFTVPASADGRTAKTEYQYTFWFSDRSSNFLDFPGIDDE